MSISTLSNKRIELAAQIRQFTEKYNANPSGWTQADEEAYCAANTEYDKAQAEWEKSNNLGKYTRNELERGPVTSRFGTENQAVLTDRAVCAWSRNQMGFPISEQEAQVCNSYGISAASNVFVINFTPSLPMQGAQLFRNSLASRDGTSGGYTVPQGFMANLERAMLDASGMLAVSDVWRTDTGWDTPWPTVDDTSNTGELIGENTAVSEQDVAFAAKVFRERKISSKLVKVPYELLRDNNVQLADQLGVILGERIGRKLNALATAGTGAGVQPYGITTVSTLGKTATSATALAMDDVIDLEHSVDPAYRTASNGCGFMMHDNIAAAARKLKDGDGNYLWKDPVTDGQPPRLHGWPVTINQDMDSTIASGKKTMLFGAFRKFKIRLVAQLRLRRLVERYAESDQEGFIGFQSFDCNLLDAGTHPVKHMIH